MEQRTDHTSSSRKTSSQPTVWKKISGLPLRRTKDLCHMEELNYSKAAIRYSETLTKDQVFTGLRMLLHQIGDACGEGRNVSIDFEMGTLVCIEGEPRFAFAAELYLAEGLQVPSGAAEDLNYKPSVSFAEPTKEALALRLDGSQISTAASATSRESRGNTGAELASAINAGVGRGGYGPPSVCESIAEDAQGSAVWTGADEDWAYNPCSDSGADVLSLAKDVHSEPKISSEIGSSRGSVTYGSMRGGGIPPPAMEPGIEPPGQLKTRHEHAFQEAMTDTSLRLSPRQKRLCGTKSSGKAISSVASCRSVKTWNGVGHLRRRTLSFCNIRWP